MALASALNMSGLDSAKPSSGFIAGRIYFATDTSKLYYDNGTALVAYTFGTGGGGGAGGNLTGTAFGIWVSTAAITELTFLPAAGNFIIGSRISLYGIA